MSVHQFTIRKIKPGKWRGYSGGVRVSEFLDTETETAEQAAKQWLAAGHSPKPVEPTKPVEPKAEPPGQTVTITINTDGITDEQKAEQKFKSAYREMYAQLTAPGFIPVLCAHEIAHKIYFMVAGVPEDKFVPHSAKLRYDPTIDDYVGDLAGIQLLELPPWTPGKFDEWLFNIARGHAAGGLVARKLMPSSDGGDKDDRERFKKLCDEFNKDPKVKIDWQYWWTLAQEAITKELENPEFVKAIQQHAVELRAELGL
jgi:hypothetical protein